MVYVDDLARHLRAQLVGEDLHVAGENDEFGAGLLDQFQELRFCLRLVLLRHIDVVEGDVVIDNHILIIEVVGDNAHDVDRQCANLPSIE